MMYQCSIVKTRLVRTTGDTGSCDELVKSAPYNLDGGFFLDIETG